MKLQNDSGSHGTSSFPAKIYQSKKVVPHPHPKGLRINLLVKERDFDTDMVLKKNQKLKKAV